MVAMAKSKWMDTQFPQRMKEQLLNVLALYSKSSFLKLSINLMAGGIPPFSLHSLMDMLWPGIYYYSAFRWSFSVAGGDLFIFKQSCFAKLSLNK